MSVDKIHQRQLLIERTRNFGKDVREFCVRLPVSFANSADVKQVIRSSGSIGANYIEACESFSKRDCIARMRISRKEARESLHWLYLVNTRNSAALEEIRKRLLQEGTELLLIFSTIIQKLTTKKP